MGDLAIATVGWGISTVGWMICPVVTRFINKCFENLEENVPEKLKDLQTITLPKLKLIYTVTRQYEEHRATSDPWLKRLKAAFDEAEDMLDLVEYERLEKEVNSHSFPDKFKIGLKSAFSPQKKNLKKSLKELEKLAEEGTKLVGTFNIANNMNQNVQSSSAQYYRVTTHSPPPIVIGRDKDRDDIIKLLHRDQPESSNATKPYSVVAICGLGGSGKTTLAQYIYEKEKKDEYFDLVMWIHVSENFDVSKIMSKMWESAFGDACPHYNSLSVLQSRLEAQLKNKRILLVLDDVWCDKGVSEQEIGQIFAPLRVAQNGTSVLVTTRIEGAAKALGAANPIRLSDLKREQFLLLFLREALDGAKFEDANHEEKLKKIGEKIANKLHRSPLAAKAVAGILRRTLHVDFWENVLDQDLLKDIKGVLLFSYQHLDEPLQRCFAFWRIFPKGEQKTRNELVDMWIAHGCIGTSSGGEQLEVIGERYFDELVSASFIHTNDDVFYSIHDLFHDLAMDVSGDDCFVIINEGTQEIPLFVKHLYISCTRIKGHIENICKLSNLRTLMLHRPIDLNHDLLDFLFNNLRKLRVLELDFVYNSRLPRLTGYLKHLRCLKLEWGTFLLPNSLCKLFHLQFLIHNTWLVPIEDILPYKMCNLVNLRRLSGYYPNFPHVGRLTSLQSLERFTITKETGYELHQIGNLKDLRGTLEICNLEEVLNKEEALAAKLAEKKGISQLILKWSYGEPVNTSHELQEQTMEGLCPPAQLKKLHFENYGGGSFPNWIRDDNSALTNLQVLKLDGCHGLEALPETRMVFQNLESLILKDVIRLKRIQKVPKNMIKLVVDGCISLAFYSREELESIIYSLELQISQFTMFIQNNNHGDNIKNHSYFNQQRELIFKIKSLSNHTIANSVDLLVCLKMRIDFINPLENNNQFILPFTLEKLVLKSFTITNSILHKCLQGLASLTHMELCDIITITSIPAETLSSLTNLLVLRIEYCLLLTSLGGVETISQFLEEFTIIGCPNLIMEKPRVSDRPVIFSSLKRLKLHDRRISGEAEYFLHDVTSLKELHLENCPAIESIDVTHIRSLHKLEMINCSHLRDIWGLNVLEKYSSMTVIKCPRIAFQSVHQCDPKPYSLTLDDISFVPQLLSRDGQASVGSLTIQSSQEDSFSQEQIEILTNFSLLITLRFEDCTFRCLPGNLSSLTNLLYLSFYDCTNISSLPYLPPSLQYFTVGRCNSGFKNDCKRKTAHIPGVDIS